MTETIQLTSEQIAKYRSELADNSDFLAALDVIEEWDGDLADAAESIATRNGIEGVEDNADMRWFVAVLNKCRESICQQRYEIVREKIVPALIPTLTEMVAASFLCPPGIATLLSTPIAIYVQEEGMNKFCQISTDD
ncbi:MAG: hypothetical protein AN485_01440 [Anabaena sp. MDT14b]|jgi:hypothetical protein|nr:MAG: hypothetical protein AN485_01440 [Anabaena sp. MDT14b]QSV62227.1 MAG: hypothetical protein HEQ26_05105 [Dolichospermum sp. DL01]